MTRLLKLPWCGRSRKMIKLVFRIEIHRRAVSTEIPRSEASAEKFSSTKFFSVETSAATFNINKPTHLRILKSP